jgi:homoserine O-acetyltransferase
MKLPFAPGRLLILASLIVLLVTAASLAASAQTAEGEQKFAELGACKLDSGQEITGCRLGYRTWGKLNAAGSNAVLAPTWFTGTSAGLSDAIVKSKIADPAKFFVIVVDALGDGVSS